MFKETSECNRYGQTCGSQTQLLYNFVFCSFHTDVITEQKVPLSEDTAK